jgi:hypothetical protein
LGPGPAGRQTRPDSRGQPEQERAFLGTSDASAAHTNKETPVRAKPPYKLPVHWLTIQERRALQTRPGSRPS